MEKIKQPEKVSKKSSKYFVMAIAILVVAILGIALLALAELARNEKKQNCETYNDCEVPIVGYKPVIYLYPAQKQNIQVKMNNPENFTVTYPEYNNGWDVIAYPDGRIINLTDNQEYSYLFWEGINKDATYDLSTGFVVEGLKTADFLQNKLAELGLTPKEYNEFIVYWLPQMLHNKYNLIHFATKEEYDDKMVLNITPKPDSMLRIFMTFKKIDSEIKIKPQELKQFTRTGFTVVEWGGTEIK